MFFQKSSFEGSAVLRINTPMYWFFTMQINDTQQSAGCSG